MVNLFCIENSFLLIRLITKSLAQNNTMSSKNEDFCPEANKSDSITKKTVQEMTRNGESNALYRLLFVS